MEPLVALKCKQCGAPMESRRECKYCGTKYYSGPEIPDAVLPTRAPGNGWSDMFYNTYQSTIMFSSISTAPGVYSDSAGSSNGLSW